jgi:protein arginine N-methyltransferase 1
MFRTNGADGIRLFARHSSQVSLPERVDIIVHELIGVDAHDEKLLRTIDDARERFLKPGGRLIPSAIVVECIGIELENPAVTPTDELVHEVTTYGRVYGLNVEPLCSAAKRQSALERLRRLSDAETAEPRRHILSEASAVCAHDLYAIRSACTVEQGGVAELRISRPGRLGALVLFFRATLDESTELTNSPLLPRTSWGYLVVPLDRAVDVQPGAVVPISIRRERTVGRTALVASVA